MKAFLAVFVTLCIFVLYFIPPVMISKGGENGWGAFYIVCVALSLFWGWVLWDKWDNL